MPTPRSRSRAISQAANKGLLHRLKTLTAENVFRELPPELRKAQQQRSRAHPYPLYAWKDPSGRLSVLTLTEKGTPSVLSLWLADVRQLLRSGPFVLMQLTKDATIPDSVVDQLRDILPREWHAGVPVSAQREGPRVQGPDERDPATDP